MPYSDDRFVPGADSQHHQPYYGPFADRVAVYPPEPWIRNQPVVGQTNPYVRERLNMQHGGYLNGLGQFPPLGPQGGDPHYESSHVRNLEQEDDVYGSGIFDEPGAFPTANADMGIFSSDYSLPGYLGREIPFTVSRDVTDITAGSDVVMIPAGGKAVVEHRGQAALYPVTGPTPRPPFLRPTMRPTAIDEPYVSVMPGAQPRPLHAAAPQTPPPSYEPGRTFRHPVRSIPAVPQARRVPSTATTFAQVQGTEPSPFRPGRAIDRVAQPWMRRAGLPPGIVPRPQFGQEPDESKTVGVGTMVVAGLMLGAAAGMLMGAVKAKGKAR